MKTKLGKYTWLQFHLDKVEGQTDCGGEGSQAPSHPLSLKGTSMWTESSL